MSFILLFIASYLFFWSRYFFYFMIINIQNILRRSQVFYTINYLNQLQFVLQNYIIIYHFLMKTFFSLNYRLKTIIIHPILHFKSFINLQFSSFLMINLIKNFMIIFKKEMKFFCIQLHQFYFLLRLYFQNLSFTSIKLHLTLINLYILINNKEKYLIDRKFTWKVLFWLTILLCYK